MHRVPWNLLLCADMLNPKVIIRSVSMMKKILSMILLLAMLLPVLCIIAPKAEAAYTAEQWMVLGNKFHTFLCGSTDNDMTNPSVKQIITKIDSNCKT